MQIGESNESQTPTQSPKFDSLVSHVLQQGETLVWSGQPSCILYGWLPLFLLLSCLLFYTGAFTVLGLRAGLPSIPWELLAIGIAMVVWCLIGPLAGVLVCHWSQARRTLYLLTTDRAIHCRPTWRGQYVILETRPENLRAMFVPRYGDPFTEVAQFRWLWHGKAIRDLFEQTLLPKLVDRLKHPSNAVRREAIVAAAEFARQGKVPAAHSSLRSIARIVSFGPRLLVRRFAWPRAISALPALRLRSVRRRPGGFPGGDPINRSDLPGRHRSTVRSFRSLRRSAAARPHMSGAYFRFSSPAAIDTPVREFRIKSVAIFRGPRQLAARSRLSAVQVKLLCRDTLAHPRVIVLDQFPSELGRGADVAVRIDDRWLSRRHCRLDVAEGVVVVRDLGSRHGTFVNGKSINECKFLPGDELCIGLSHFVAEYDAASQTTEPVSAACGSAAGVGIIAPPQALMSCPP